MAIRYGTAVDLTVACAMIGGHLAHMEDYHGQVLALRQLIQFIAAEHGFFDCSHY